jgi:hypothetical protein
VIELVFSVTEITISIFTLTASPQPSRYV